MTGFREAQLLDAVNALLDARRTLVSLPALPEPLVPTSYDEVFFIQDRIAASFGEVGGWKVGAPSPDATPLAAPMPAHWIGPDNTRVGGPTSRLRGVEAEVAFLLGSDLPPRATPYTHDEVYAAVLSCHPAIEILESGLLYPTDPVLRMSQLADLQMHGGFVFGPACPDWKATDWNSIDFTQEPVTLAIEGSIRVERTGSNTSGDLLRLLPWLANEGAARTGGLRAGQWITTGSWTGAEFSQPNTAVDVLFAHLGKVHLYFA